MGILEQAIENAQYFFYGQLFLDYIDYDVFKKAVKEETGIEPVLGEEFSVFYQRSIFECGNKNQIDKLFFENIMYGRLTNVFIHKINNSPIKQDIFLTKVKELINYWNEGSHLPEALKELMVPDPNGYYLMDRLSYTKPNTKFVAGVDFETSDGLIQKARFLVVKVVPTGKKQDVKIRYQITGIEIDFINQTFNIYVKNMQNILSDDANEEDFKDDDTRTVIKAHNYYLNRFKQILGLDITIDTEEDRKGMFTLCKELTDIMLEEVRSTVIEKTEAANNESVNKLVGSLFTSTIQSLVDKNDLQSRFLSVLIATYIQVMLDDEDFINIAKERKLIGYPIRVSFKKENASQGSTKSSGATSPITSQIMFHSLQTDFEEALQLPKWAISWFKDIEYRTGSCEVVPTSISCRNEYFHVIFTNHKYIGKELLLHVTRELNKYRNY